MAQLLTLHSGTADYSHTLQVCLSRMATALLTLHVEVAASLPAEELLLLKSLAEQEAKAAESPLHAVRSGVG